MKKLSVLLSVILLLFMSACSSSDSDDFLIITASQYYHQPADGDVFTYDDTLVETVDGGDPVTTDYERVCTFSEVDENLYTLYLYGDDASATYLLETSTEDGTDAGYTYYSLDGIEIIHDDLTTFSINDPGFSVRSGSDEPGTVLLGIEYPLSQVDLLFSSADPTALVGNYTFEATIIPDAIETITVPSGEFECLRFEISGESVTTIETTDPDTVTTSRLTGYKWYARGIGLVKIELDYETEITGPASSSITRAYTSELSDVSL